MNLSTIKRVRVGHMLAISVLVVTAIVEPLRILIPYWEFVLAAGFVVCWILGVRYERRVVVESGVAEASELRIAERNAASWLIKGRDPEDPR